MLCSAVKQAGSWERGARKKESGFLPFSHSLSFVESCEKICNKITTAITITPFIYYLYCAFPIKYSKAHIQKRKHSLWRALNKIEPIEPMQKNRLEVGKETSEFNQSRLDPCHPNSGWLPLPTGLPGLILTAGFRFFKMASTKHIIYLLQT